MNPLKVQVKILTAEKLGRDIEGMIEGAHKRTFLQQGAKEGLELGSSKVSELMAHIDAELKEGVIGNLDGPISIAEYVKRYIKRCVGVLDNLATQAEVSRLMFAGQEKAFKEANEHINKFWKEEKNKLESFLKDLEETNKEGGGGNGEVKYPDNHPGPSLKMQRTQDEMTQDKKTEGKKKTEKKTTKKKAKKNGSTKKLSQGKIG
jgi:hypothetical protein